MSRSGSRSQRWFGRTCSRAAALTRCASLTDAAYLHSNRSSPPLRAQPLQQSPDGFLIMVPFSRGSLENSGLVRERKHGTHTQHSWVAITRPRRSIHSAHAWPASKAGHRQAKARLDVVPGPPRRERGFAVSPMRGRCDYKSCVERFSQREKASG